MPSPFAPPRLSLRLFAVWRRNFLVWRKLALPSIVGNLADPVIYMLGLGYGLGMLVPEVEGVSYIAFLAGGKDGAFEARLEAMAKALATLMSAKWYRWQVRLV